MEDKLADAFPLQWPIGWKRTGIRTRSGFGDHPFGKVRNDLLHQLKLLRVSEKGIVLSTNIPLKRDGFPYANQANPADPGVAVYFKRSGKPMVFACDCYVSINDNIWAICKTIEALRGIERWGASDMLERSFTGFAALPAPPVEPPWWKTLRITDIADEATVRGAYRFLAKTVHPDVGGSHDAWLKIQRAYEMAMKRFGAK